MKELRPTKRIFFFFFAQLARATNTFGTNAKNNLAIRVRVADAFVAAVACTAGAALLIPVLWPRQSLVVRIDLIGTGREREGVHTTTL